MVMEAVNTLLEPRPMPNFVETCASAQCVALDGCSAACVKYAFENVGLCPDVHIVATELGIEKAPRLDFSKDERQRIVAAAIEALQSSAGGCGGATAD